jgi:two-component system chemotaxis sensor kinase CheA
MSLSEKIREQIISSFHTELAEHVQTMNDGLLSLEQQRVSGPEREETLANIFRAAHSLKGAARAVGVSAIEQLAHALEDVLGALQRQALAPSASLFTACYQAIDAIQSTQAAYEEGQISPPPPALKALVALDEFRTPPKSIATQPQPAAPTPQAQPPEPSVLPATQPDPGNHGPGMSTPQRKAATDPVLTRPTDQNPEAAEPAPDQTAPNWSGASTPAPTQPGTADETIRVSVSKLDALMAQLSELLVIKIHAQQRLNQVRQAQELIALWQKEWFAVRSAYSLLTRHSQSAADEAYQESATRFKELRSLLDFVSASQEQLREMSVLINSLSREYQSDTLQMSLVIDGLEDEIKRVRMLPLSTITGTFARMVRDLAQSYNKQAVLEIIGGDVELDKRVLELIKDPLIHLLRNAVDHGIETPERRVALNKPPIGIVTLSAEHSGKDVIISVKDDGSGVDVEAIRKTAVRRNIPNAATLSEEELVELIYHTGFSTSAIITDISGRGVGLDIVRLNVENLHGRIHLEWKPGEGSRFILTIPLSLTSSRGLLVNISDRRFAIPLNSIERILHIRPEEVATVGGHDTLRYDGRPLMLSRLGDVLGLPRRDGQLSDGQRIPVVVLSAAERRMAFMVDELIDEQEIVIKGLGRQLSRVGCIAGASVMGSGEVILILQVADLIKLAQRGDHRPVLETTPADVAHPVQSRPQRQILVVDDSITTRTLEKNILEAAGYDVQLANDGLEAINLILGNDLPDLIISDIAMPRLDGFDLTKRLKKEARTRGVPVILVTSLDLPEDKARGIEAGADAYIVKSSFDQNNLLETIEQLMV